MQRDRPSTLSNEINHTGRRRKIRCIYPEEATRNATSTIDLNVDASHATETRTNCIECQTHDRHCEIQGLVTSSAESSCLLKAPSVSHLPGRIYKRRRDFSDADGANGQLLHSGGDQDLPRVKLRVNRIDSVVQRLTRERENASSAGVKANLTQRGIKPSSLNETNGMSGRSAAIHHNTDPQRSNGAANVAKDTTAAVLASDYDVNKASPLLTQLFNNEMVCIYP